MFAPLIRNKFQSTDVNLMGVLKEALSENEVLWGHLTLAKNISLEEMMDTVSKWKSKSQKAQISTDSADGGGKWAHTIFLLETDSVGGLYIVLSLNQNLCATVMYIKHRHYYQHNICIYYVVHLLVEA